MEHTDIVAVALANYSVHLDTLVRRAHTFTVMRWAGSKELEAPDGGTYFWPPMATPYRILESGKQETIPFLFSPTDQDQKQVTHIGVSGLIFHREEAQRIPDHVRRWLSNKRVECFDPANAGVEWTLDDGASFYVVTGTEAVDPSPIPYEHLLLVNDRRPLSPDKRQGYSMVFLPTRLEPLYRQASNKWKEA